MNDLSRKIDRCLETVEVLRATVPGFDMPLDLMELTLNECKELAEIPVLTDRVEER